MKSYFKIVAWINAGLWAINGIATMASSYLARELVYIDFIVGTTFILIALYNYLKAKNTLLFIEQYKNTCKAENYEEAPGYFNKFILFQNISLIIFTVIAIVVSAAVYSRIFTEGVSVFG